jgi:phosphotransferase system enzyme I (PtsI)
MKRLEGMPISPGYASGIAVVYDYEIERRLETPSRSISNLEVDSERSRLSDALERSSHDLKSVEQSTLSEPRLVDSAALLSAHAAMAKEIAAIVRQHIGRELVNAEEALEAVIREFVVRFGRLESTYFREREQDVRDVGRRLMGHLLGSTSWLNEPLPPGSVIVARELLPSETVELAKSGVIAIVAEHGGTFSHTAIVARSLGIPAVTGIADVTSHVQPGMRLLVDGESGSVVLAPSEAEEARFVDREREFGIRIAATATQEELPCVTRDGIEISLLGNIGLPAEVEGVSQHNLAGAGLFRTEFLFLESHQRPSLEMQSEIYNDMARGLGELPLVIRTFDLGGDKLPPFILSEGSDIHANLHLRGLRFSLDEVHLLETQLTAILHVAQTADVRILFPMVVGSDDFARAIATVERVADRLGFLRRPPIGAMLETPAALYALDEILELADFVAIGTNDLTQYMLAADRDLAEGTDDCTATHPAVLRAIRQIIEAAEQRQCPVCVCGEEAADPSFACLLVGLGIRELSLTPTRAAAVRQMLRGITCVDAGEVADLALQCRTPQQVRELLQNLPSAEASVSRQAGQLSEPSALTLSGASVATQLSGPATDRRQSLRDTNESLTQRVAESTSRLSTANTLLTTARQDEQLAAVAFETHDSIMITDKDGKILRVNKSFTELTGYASEDVVGKSPRVLKSGRHGEEFYREMWQTIQAQGYWQGEIWNRRKDGYIYLQRLTITCVKNDSGEITHYVGDGQDLTQQRQGEADLAAISAARKVQRTLFPSSAPCLPGFDIAGAVHPAERVSGDFFDYLPLGQDSIGVLVADVSGHGLGPALLMAQTQAYLRALAETCADPGELLAGVNRLFATSDSGHFVTMFLGRLDVATRSFSYVGAGHQAYLIAKDGAVRVLRSHSIPIGVENTMTPCTASRITLEAGDILVVPTDGTEEAMSVDGRQFGRERIFDLVRNNRDKPAVDIVEALFQAARDFSEQRPQEDDITALIVKVLPTASARTSDQPEGCG